MSMQHDPELDDILQDAELMQVAEWLRQGRMADPPLDEAFRSALRRQLMNRAWGMGDGSVPWWRKLFGPSTLAWASGAVGVVLIAAIVVFMSKNPTQQDTRTVIVSSPMSDQAAVRLQQPILVTFNQPMDHQATQNAVQITPATTVAFTWNANTLSVQPTSGDLAPNTQYQVTIGPGAKTATGESLATPKTITFVTQPPPAPAPSPTPSPSPTPGPLGQRQLAAVTGGAISNLLWSPDSSAVYFITGKGALESVPAAGGTMTSLAPDGVTSAAITTAGDKLAYVRGGKIEILDLKALVVTSEVTVNGAPSVVGWGKQGVEWTVADAVYTQGDSGPVKTNPLPSGGQVSAVSFSPDGSHLAYTQDQSLQVMDLATGKSIVLGLAGARFFGWSPDSTGLMFSGAQGVIASDVSGKTIATLPAGEPSWSSLNEILLGSDIDVFEVRPDGSGLTKLGDGSYHSPVWAPNGTAFTYVRGGSLFTASAPPPPPRSSALDLASSVVNSFMQARKAKLQDKATGFLDDNGRKAYSGTNGGLNLVVAGDPSFSRYYLLTQEITGSQPDTARFVVRIVLSHDKLDVSTYEETLSLVRTQGSDQFLIDQATAGPLLSLGKGAEVVSVDVSHDTVKITFDSDLKPGTVANGVIILDSKGKQVGDTPAYAHRTVTVGGLDLKPGETYKLVVLSTLQDVEDNNIPSEYDLNFLGPDNSHGADTSRDQGASPSTHASPTPTPPSS